MNIIQCAVEFAEEYQEKKIALIFNSQEALKSEVLQCSGRDSWIHAEWQNPSRKRGYCIIRVDSFCGDVRVVAFDKSKPVGWGATELWYADEISDSEAENFQINLSDRAQRRVSFRDVLNEARCLSNTTVDDIELNEYIDSLLGGNSE